MIVGHAAPETSARSRPEHAALPRHATSTWMAYASITAVEPSLDSAQQRRFSPCCHRMRSAIPSHTLAALTALLIREKTLLH